MAACVSAPRFEKYDSQPLPPHTLRQRREREQRWRRVAARESSRHYTPVPSAFTMRSAKSGSLMGVVAFAVVIETSLMHLLLSARHPLIAWTLTMSSVWLLWWLWTDLRALGTSTVIVGAETI